MANAIFGYNNRIESSTLTAGSEVAGLNVSQLASPQGSSATSWQTATGVKTAAAGAWFMCDAGYSTDWQAFLLARTNLTPSAQIRWRVGELNGVVESTPLVNWDIMSEANTLPSGWTFTRAGGTGESTYMNSSGTLVSASANTPRFNYSLGILQGLLMEPARTNRVRNPKAIFASTPTYPTSAGPTNWGYAAISGLSATITSSGTENGIPYVDFNIQGTAVSNAGAFLVYYDDITAAPAYQGEYWTHSQFAKLVSGTIPTLFQHTITEYNASSTQLLAQQFSRNVSTTLTTASLGTQRSSNSTIIGSATAAYARPSLFLQFANGAVNSTIRIGLPQFEKGEFVTMPIMPSGTVTGTYASRPADQASYTLSSGWYSTGFTLHAETNTKAVATSVGTAVGFEIAVEDTGSNNIVSLRSALTGGIPYYDYVAKTASSVVADGDNILVAPGLVSRQAVSVTQDNIYQAISGIALTTDTSAALPTGLNKLVLRPGNGETLMYVRNVKLYSSNLTSGQTLALSTDGTTIDPSVLTFDSGTIAAGVLAGYGQSFTFASAYATGRYCRCDINDSLNPDGRISVGLAFAGPIWQPAINMSADSCTGVDAQVDEVITRGGQEYPQYRYERRRWDIGLEYIASSEVWTQAAEIHRAARHGANILFSPDPSSGYAEREVTFGRAQSLSDFQYSNQITDYRSWRLRVTERL
jgi:hypothetical protein